MSGSALLISHFVTGPVTVTRFGTSPGVDENGMILPGATSTFTVEISIQPMNGKDLRNLSMRLQDTRRVEKGYCADELFTAKRSPSNRADRVAYNNTVFEVLHVERWEGDLPHWKVYLVEIDA